KPKSSNGARDWEDSFNRQMELYRYLQSPKGAIAGGVTNSWNGQYEKYPAGKSTFYDMAYDDNPVYHDPGSNTWPGFQGWSMERIAELYYEFNNRDAKALMDKWANWAISEIQLNDDGTFAIPARFEWSGEPDEWNPSNPGNNSNLDVVVTDYGTDLGVTASFARTLIYYAAAAEKHDGAMHQESADVAKELLDRMWVLYRDDIGVAAPEKRGDYKRFNDEVYIPKGYNGKMANGADIKNGVTFTDLRPNYKQDPNWNKLQAAIAAGEDFEISYHRGWAQMEIAMANAEYALLIGDGPTAPQVKITTPKNGANFNSGTTIVVKADATDRDGTVESVEFFANGTSIGVDYNEPWSVNYVNAPDSPAIDITAEATDNDGLTGTSRPGAVVISVGNAAPVAIISEHASEVKKGMEVCFDASESYDINNDALTYTWDIEGFTYTSVSPCHSFTQGPKTVTIELTVSDGQASSTVTSQIEVTDKPDCFFGLPSAAPLATTGYSPYSHINVYSKNAPQILENVTQFVINWDLQNNGLWQFSMLTNNGQPTWWMDLRSVTTYKFNQNNPELTISGSGFAGLDGSYYVGKVDGDFIMVEKSGAYTIQFTNNPTPVDCNPTKAATELSISGLTTPLAYPNPATDVLFIRDLQDTKQIEIL
ncbi:MAG: Ig-like domain-containing protein, partial [Bacteroidales bacterium]|nr:Ig-like domain-containing protein [Bacteroidales bacterium]